MSAFKSDLDTEPAGQRVERSELAIAGPVGGDPGRPDGVRDLLDDPPPEEHAALEMGAQVRPHDDAAAEIDVLVDVGRRGQQAPVVVVEALVAAKRRDPRTNREPTRKRGSIAFAAERSRRRCTRSAT